MIIILIGIVGKPSSGKSTFLNAACLTNAKVGNYPFTTIEPNLGTGFARVVCICKELGVQDNPKNSMCVNHNRFIQIKLIDVAGLVPDAHLGRGMGNQFLSDLSRADVLIHILDISGETNAEGNDLHGGEHDPFEDIVFLEKEIDFWFKDILLRQDWARFTNKIRMDKLNFVEELYERLSGLSIRRANLVQALEKSRLNISKPESWSEQDLEHFSRILRQESKPILIVANKIDKKRSLENFENLKTKINVPIIPASSLAENVLRKLAEQGKIEYYPGDSDFKILKPNEISEQEKKTLESIREKILLKFGNTGVQNAINFAIFNLLNEIVVYPVYDEKKYTDKDGNVIPDAFIIPDGMNIKDFVNEKIHSELAKNLLYGIDARTKMKLGKDYKLKNNDIIKVVSAIKGK